MLDQHIDLPLFVGGRHPARGEPVMVPEIVIRSGSCVVCGELTVLSEIPMWDEHGYPMDPEWRCVDHRREDAVPAEGSCIVRGESR